jgi:NADH dehydrogenase/NADH:ubiquinone oxidoreductase subunit G
MGKRKDGQGNHSMGGTITILVDQRVLEVEEGSRLLQACLDNGIYIPNLCHLEWMASPAVSCRMCFVDVKGMPGPVPACSLTVREGMEVTTDTAEVRRLQRSALRLLLSVHEVDCPNCPAHKRCELQKIAAFLKVGLKQKRFEPYRKSRHPEEEHPFLYYDPNRCILCGKCIQVCRRKHGKTFLNFAKRGLETIISFYGEQALSKLPCEGRPACVEICPVAAITWKEGEDRTPKGGRTH